MSTLVQCPPRQELDGPARKIRAPDEDGPGRDAQGAGAVVASRGRRDRRDVQELAGARGGRDARGTAAAAGLGVTMA